MIWTDGVRTVSETTSVRLYHRADGVDGGAATTLLYGSLAEAMARAARESDEVQAGLFLATENDVVAYLDLID
nr:hypothetical protein [Sphingomonas sp. CROZ-RG-20F-R02-07]